MTKVQVTHEAMGTNIWLVLYLFSAKESMAIITKKTFELWSHWATAHVTTLSQSISDELWSREVGGANGSG